MRRAGGALLSPRRGAIGRTLFVDCSGQVLSSNPRLPSHGWVFWRMERTRYERLGSCHTDRLCRPVRGGGRVPELFQTLPVLVRGGCVRGCSSRFTPTTLSLGKKPKATKGCRTWSEILFNRTQDNMWLLHSCGRKPRGRYIATAGF